MNRRYGRISLILLSVVCGTATGLLTIAGLAMLLLDHDAAHLSPWLDPYMLSNWIILCGIAVGGLGLALLAEREPTIPNPIPLHHPVAGPEAKVDARDGDPQELRHAA